MIDSNKLIQITLPPVNPTFKFDITTVAGRDDIADQIKLDIDEYSRLAFVDESRRTHLGASKIGHKCDRHIWYHFRWFKRETITGRQARLFRRGHKEEENVIELLRGIGIKVEQVDVDGKQFRIADIGGHFGGSSDGKAVLPERYNFLTEVLLEVKTANKKWFDQIFGSGVIKVKPEYWVQQCLYGYKRGLKYALFICVGKNDDDLDIEVLELDYALAQSQLTRAANIINSPNPPIRMSNEPSFWECKFCEFWGQCFLGEKAEKNCRSCRFAQPIDNKEWKCHNFNQIIPPEFIQQGCDGWQQIGS